MNLIYIRKSKDSRSCNCCHAQNYRGAFPVINKYVDTIYEVNIGGLVPALCEECLQNLYGVLRPIVQPPVPSTDDDADCYCE